MAEWQLQFTGSWAGCPEKGLIRDHNSVYVCVCPLNISNLSPVVLALRKGLQSMIMSPVKVMTKKLIGLDGEGTFPVCVYVSECVCVYVQYNYPIKEW